MKERTYGEESEREKKVGRKRGEGEMEKERVIGRGKGA